MNLGKRGVMGTISLPGTGLSYQHRFTKIPAPGSTQSPPTAASQSSANSGGFKVTLVIGAAVIALAIGGLAALQSPQGTSPTQIATSGTSTVQPVAPPPIIQPANSATPAIPAVTKEITAIQANVRAEPSMAGAVLQVLARGEIVQVLQSENGWLRVSRRDGAALGWVHNSVLK